MNAMGRAWARQIGGPHRACLRSVVAACLAALGVGCGDDSLAPAGPSSSTSTGPARPASTTATASTSSGAQAPDSGNADTTGVAGLPPVPALSSPADGALRQPRQTELCWSPVEDPDGDEVRYRVFVDDLELTRGILGADEGYVGPCTGLLNFDYEQTYRWRVLAFEVEDPTRASAPSKEWVFTVEPDGSTNVVFEDAFDNDLGWETGGDATAGAWVRGDPTTALDGLSLSLSQPEHCFGGSACYYTGDNTARVPDDEDVAGGSTIMTSPAFDLSGAAAATVELTRFFYKSGGDPARRLRVDLLVPDAAAPDGIAVYPLESLADPTAAVAHNLWAPQEYAICGVPMLAGTRLRVTATDAGSGILEAAIDSVTVRAQRQASVCGSGEGGQCDPTQGAAACPDALLCCSQGTLNAGVYRCDVPVAGMDFNNPTKNPRDPNNGPLGCDAPDLIVDPTFVDPVLTDIFVSEATCELLEGCVGGTGTRTILRFSAWIANVGARDLVFGVVANNPDAFDYSDCHDHYHFDEFANYRLLAGADVVATGHKQAFCLLDSGSWAWNLPFGNYDCANQGISRGFYDIYESDLPCQWIDVTGVPPGDYLIRAELNPVRYDSLLPRINERDYGNNFLEVAVTLPIR